MEVGDWPHHYGSGVASFGDTLTRTEVLPSIISANTNSDVDCVLGTADNTFLSKGFNRLGDGDATAAFNNPGDQSLVMVPGLGKGTSRCDVGAFEKKAVR